MALLRPAASTNFPFAVIARIVAWTIGTINVPGANKLARKAGIYAANQWLNVVGNKEGQYYLEVVLWGLCDIQ